MLEEAFQPKALYKNLIFSQFHFNLKMVWLFIRFLEVSLSLLECAGAKLVFTIRSSEVFALRGDLLYIFYGSCSVSSLVRGYSLVRGFVFS